MLKLENASAVRGPVSHWRLHTLILVLVGSLLACLHTLRNQQHHDGADEAACVTLSLHKDRMETHYFFLTHRGIFQSE